MWERLHKITLLVASQFVSFGKEHYSDTVKGKRCLGHVAHGRERGEARTDYRDYNGTLF